MNVAQTLALAAPLFQGRPVLQYREQEHAFVDVMAQAGRLIDAMQQRGLRPGERVVLAAKNKPEWVISMLAALGAGAVVVPVNPALTASEIGYIVEHCEPAMIFADQDLAAAVAPLAGTATVVLFGGGNADSWEKLVAEGRSAVPWVERGPEDPAVIFYTSGTTGRPKGVLLSHRAVHAITDIATASFQVRAGDSSLICGSLSFIYSIITNCFSCIRSGATVILQDRFHPEYAVRAIEQQRISIFMGVPTMFTMMLNWAQDRTVDLSSLRLCLSSGQSLPWSVAVRVKERFGLTLYDFWGQTEGTPITGYIPSMEPQGRPDSCGRALPGCGVRVIDNHGNDLPPEEVGEVLLTGPSIMTGYYRNPQATEETLREGWIHTGDLGKLDADGYLYVVGRKRDMIIRGGANIYPVEIEEALYSHPRVRDCAVIGVPDAIFGEAVKACVVSSDGGEVTADELRRHCRERLAEYKIPASFEFLEELPKGPTGKILKRVLTEKCRLATSE